MTQYPVLCINPGCRPDDLGGPRRTENAWFCTACIDRASTNLDHIADTWEDLEESLTRSEIGRDTEQGKTKNAGKGATGIQINERALHARTKTSALMWFMIRDILDRYDETGRTLTLPTDQTTPSLARWLAKWHIAGFATHPGDELAVEVFVDIRRARNDVHSAAYPTGAKKLETGLPCVEYGDSDTGEHVKCPGTLHAWVGPQTATLPDLVCSEDRAHKVDPTTWQRAGWKRAHSGRLDHDAMARLAHALTS